MNTRFWTIAGYAAGAFAAVLIIVLFTLAFTTPDPVTPKFIAAGALDVLLGLAASKLISVDLSEERGRKQGRAEGFEEGYDQGWVEGAAHRPPRDNVTHINGAASPGRVQQRSG